MHSTRNAVSDTTGIMTHPRTSTSVKGSMHIQQMQMTWVLGLGVRVEVGFRVRVRVRVGARVRVRVGVRVRVRVSRYDDPQQPNVAGRAWPVQGEARTCE